MELAVDVLVGAVGEVSLVDDQATAAAGLAGLPLALVRHVHLGVEEDTVAVRLVAPPLASVHKVGVAQNAVAAEIAFGVKLSLVDAVLGGEQLNAASRTVCAAERSSG